MTTVYCIENTPPKFVYEAAVKTFRKDFNIVYNASRNNVTVPRRGCALIDLSHLLSSKYESVAKIKKTIRKLHRLWEQYLLCDRHRGLKVNTFTYDRKEKIDYRCLKHFYPNLKYVIIRLDNSCLLIFLEENFNYKLVSQTFLDTIIVDNIMTVRNEHFANVIIDKYEVAAQQDMIILTINIVVMLGVVYYIYYCL